MIDSISGALSALRISVDLAKSAIDARDDRKLTEARSAMLDKIIDVQEACLRLQEANAALLQDKHSLTHAKRELEGQIAEMTRKADRLANYERLRTPVGTIVYVDKTTLDSPQGAIYACPACMDDGKISTLQPVEGGGLLECIKHGAFGFNTQPRGPVGVRLRPVR